MTDHYAVVNTEDLPPQPLPVQTQPPFVCEICAKTFQTSAALGVHFRTHGSNKQPCPECGIEYYPGPGMSRHRQAAHGAVKADGKPAKKGWSSKDKPPIRRTLCPDCGKEISSKDMARHRRTVHGKQPRKATTVAAVTAEDISVDDVFDAVVGLLFPRGVIPITALTPLLRWRHATDILLLEVNGG